MKEVILTNGMISLVDDEDFGMINKFRWYVDSSGYAVKTINKDRDRMHRIIMEKPVGLIIDHINGNKLDNRKENLRLCSNKENIRNSPIKKHNKSGYKGVTLFQGKYWRATICVDRKQISLGCHKTKEDAALAYNNGAILYHGKFANLNVIN